MIQKHGDTYTVGLLTLEMVEDQYAINELIMDLCRVIREQQVTIDRLEDELSYLADYARDINNELARQLKE